LTCTGKTKLLQQFSNSLDLEGLAQHRGSLYGGIGLKPNSQKKFESLLLQRLNELNSEKYIVVEGESRKIGDVQIPAFLYTTMIREGIPVLITRSLDRRAEEAVKEYFTSAAAVRKIREITLSLQKVISRKNKEEILALLEKEEYREAMKQLLELYYDPLYNHTLQKIKCAVRIDNNTLSAGASQLRRELPALLREKAI
jgi:tRNA 2-selenouridine synthase